MGYFKVQWPAILGYLAFQVCQSALNKRFSRENLPANLNRGIQQVDFPISRGDLASQVAQNNRPLYPHVAHNSVKVGRNYQPVASQGHT